MKIILSAYAFLPNSGGESGFGWHWMLSLAREVDAVEVITRLGNREDTEKYMRERDLPQNVRLHFVGIPAYLRMFNKIPTLHYFFWQWAAYQYAKKHLKVDLVHHVSLGSLHGGSWMWRLGVPLVFGPVGGGQYAPAQAKPYFPAHRWRGEILRTLLTRFLPFSPVHRFIMRHTTLTLTTNEPTTTLTQRLGGQAIPFIDSGLTSEYVLNSPRPVQTAGPLKVLWVGRLIPRKALRLALESMAACQVPVQLTVVGAGEQEGDIPGWLKELGLTDRVQVRGGVPWQEMQGLYDTHDVFLFTSLRESFGTQLMEAAARGLPIITLNLNGARLLPDEFTLKVELAEPERMKLNLAGALERFYHLHADEKARMSRAAVAFAGGETWPSRAKRIRALYDQVLHHQKYSS